jgi:iron complex transport system substrate-binding protein
MPFPSRSRSTAHRGWTRGAFGALALAISAITACGERAAPPAAEAGLRVVALVPSLTELVVALGQAEHLVARTDFDTDPAAVELPTVGGGLDPSLEQIVALEVDLVLMATGRDSPALRQRLEALGVRVEGFPVQSVDDIHDSIARLGALLGARRAADSLSGAIATELDGVRRRVAGRPIVDVLYVVWSDPPMTTGGGTFIDDVIRIAGGRNVFEDAPVDWPTVGFESIVERAPDAVIWPRGEITPENLERLKSVPGWRDVRAVQEGRVVLVDANLFNRPGPGVVIAARRLAEALHPEAF